jgi:hypothetical protein
LPNGAGRVNVAAMKIEADARISFPRDVVFATYRDRLPELVPHLPNIERITVEQREDAPGGQAGVSRLLNHWKAKGEIPKVAQAVIKPEMVAWHDHALWNENDWTCAWRTVPKMFTESIRCEGKNNYVVDGGHTILQIRGVLEIDLEGIPGVPRFLAGRVAPIVEKFIVDLLRPNLVSVAGGLEKFLVAERGG